MYPPGKCPIAPSVCWVGMVVDVLKCRKVWVNPRSIRIERVPDDETDVDVVKIRADMGGEVFNSRINPLAIDNLGKRKTRKIILSLGGYS
jgi:hypothetical protein